MRCPKCKAVMGPEDADQPSDVCLDCHARATTRAKLEAERLAAENNPHAVARRAVKVAKLIEELDRQCEYANLNPRADGLLVARMAQLWTERQWAELSLVAGCNPPSAITKRIIVERYRTRAETAQKRAAS